METTPHRPSMQITSTSAIEHDNRKNLFGSSSGRRRPKNSQNRNTTSQAASIQQSLRRTQSLLQNEMERVSHVATVIDDDGNLLKETMHTHQTLNVSKAKSALTSLQRAQRREHQVLLASMVFFWTVVFYIVWCRVLLHVPLVDRILPTIHRLVSDILHT
jgi:ribosomal protein L16 Arg81 hydroxylase